MAAAEYLVARFEELGYTAELQEFTVGTLESSLTIKKADSLEFQDLQTAPLSHSIIGEAAGELELIGLARESDIPPQGLDGKVALIERGEVTFGSKVARAADAGAIAAIIFNNRPGRFRGTLGERSEIPALSISREDGARIKEAMSGGRIEATVEVAELETQSRNVVAEKAGTGEGMLVLGGHYDTVPDVDGANDNASGIGVLLALAQELKGRSFPYTLRFIAFGSEETGLNGSRHHVNSLFPGELEEIKAMINVDAVGAGEGLRVTGETWLTGHVSETAAREAITIGVRGRMRGGSSDHASFRDAGVPVVFFSADDSSRIHTSEDTLEFVDPALLGGAAKLVMDLLESMEDLPGDAG